MVDASLENLLSPYLTPEQAALLRLERSLPTETLAGLGTRLQAELAALRTLVPEPLARDPAAFIQRSGSFWAGSLLCADLSGFTMLTERLGAVGLRGIEELSAIISRVFSALLKELQRYGGVVLKFGGDALTCFFDAATLGPEHSAAACAAALAMQRRMAELRAVATSAGTYELRLRIGVHRGAPFGVVVGDDERREVVVTGRAVARVVLLQERAAPGEILASSETIAAVPGVQAEPRVGGYALLRAVPPVTPCPLLALPSIGDAVGLEAVFGLARQIAHLRPFLPAALPRQVLLADGQARGAFRPISALFVSVASMSGLLALLDGAESIAAEALNRFYGQVQQVIHHYGGTINKFDIGSNGDRLLALFGAPVAHEDDPQRAVEAALDLGPALEQANQEIRVLLDESLPSSDGVWRAIDLSLRQRIGVATGNVYAGTVGSPQRREYTVIGQTVNLAARLMAAAEPGAVLLAPTTAAAVRELVTLEPITPLVLKGIDRPVPASAATHRKGSPSAPKRAEPPLVGRNRELGELGALAQTALAGAGRVVVVDGEAGIGKTRLVTACWEQLAKLDVRRVRLVCQAYAEHTPYSVIRNLLAHLLELPAEHEATLFGAALDVAVADLAPEFVAFAPLLDQVFALADSTPPRPQLAPGLARLPQTEQRERLHDLITALVAGCVEQQPFALLIDDLHWADASSLEVVGRLAELAEGLPFLLVLSYRTDALASASWLALRQTSHIHLGGLDEAASVALLSYLLDGYPAEGLEPLLERSQGSPFFLEALVRHMLDRGALLRDEQGVWRTREPLTNVSIPATIEPALAAQLDRLDEPTRELVQVAAVIGTSISYTVLAGVYSQARQPARRLMELVRGGILVSDEQEAQPVFRFRHSLLRDVAYQGILYAERRDLHRRVAERIEQVYAGQLERYEPELAYHYAQAEQWSEAALYALRAARYSRDRHALPEALAGYRQVWSLAEAHPEALAPADKLCALEELADIEAQAGRYDDAHRHYRQLLDRQSEAAPLTGATLLRKIGNIYEQQGLLDEALDWLQRAREQLEQTGTSGEPAPALELSRVRSAIGWISFRRGAHTQAQAWLEQALNALGAAREHADMLAERARVYNRLGGVAWMLNDMAAARMYVERSLGDFVVLGDLQGKADAQNNLGILAEQRGDWQTAIACYQDGLETNQQLDRRRAVAMSQLNLGAAHLQLGDLAAALPLLEQAATQTATLGDTFHEAMALRWLGRADTRLERFQQAAVALIRALKLAQQGQLLLEQLDAHTALGELALARTDEQGAQEAYREGQQLLPMVARSTLEAGLFLRFAAQVEKRAGNTAQAVALRAESRAILRELGQEL